MHANYEDDHSIKDKKTLIALQKQRREKKNENFRQTLNKRKPYNSLTSKP